MDWPLQVGIGIAEFVGACALGHFLYCATKAQGAMSLGLATSSPKTWGGRIYLALVTLTWVALFFAGTKKLLWWMPGDAANTFAALAALASLMLLTHLEQAAYTIHAYRRLYKVHKEFSSMVQQPWTPSQASVDRYRDKMQSTFDDVERETNQELAQITELLIKRDAQLIERTLVDMQHEAAAQAKEEQEAAAAAQQKAAKVEQFSKLKQRVEQTMTTLPSTRTVEIAPGTEALLELSVFRQKWQPLDDFAQAIKEQGVACEITSLVTTLAGVRCKNGATFQVVLEDSERDGSYEIHSTLDGQDGHLLDGLVFEQSLDGLMAAFYLRMTLPGQLAWGHGMYDKDHELLITLDRVLKILQSDGVTAEHTGLAGLTVSPGPRIKREANGALTMLCLANYPNGGYKDCAVSVEAGQASPTKATTLFDTGRRVFY